MKLFLWVICREGTHTYYNTVTWIKLVLQVICRGRCAPSKALLKCNQIKLILWDICLRGKVCRVSNIFVQKEIIYLSKSKNVFVQVSKCIWSSCKITKCRVTKCGNSVALRYFCGSQRVTTSAPASAELSFSKHSTNKISSLKITKCQVTKSGNSLALRHFCWLRVFVQI